MADAATLGQVRQLVTPEGVDLRVRIGSAGERAIALIIDFAIIFATIIIVLILAGYTAAAAHFTGAQSQITMVVWLVFFFLLRNVYFTLFECGSRAATPGKRIMGLRVAARDGGPLKADAVVARNAMRELEFWLPLQFLLSPGRDIEALIVLCGILWSFIFLLFPLFNRDRLRRGDIIAGTWVLKAPKHLLLPDLVSETRGQPGKFVFTDKQLDKYGVMELQVLEQVLRTADPTAIEAVAERIRAKIEWRRIPLESDLEFLSAYYAALRRRLEQRLLFGVRKRDKHDTR